jgi:nucleotide-binding universal stress UspA family protein
VTVDLTTTVEGRARWRAAFAEGWDLADTEDCPEHLLWAIDDIDTLLAEVDRLKREVEEAARALLRYSYMTSREGLDSADELVTALDALQEAKQ